MKYSEIYKKWRDNPIEFWKKNAEDVSWIKFPEKILTKKNENFYEWFSDSVLNTCYNAVDKNILEGRGDQVAIYYDSPINNSKSKLTYNELKLKVLEFDSDLNKYNIKVSQVNPGLVETNFSMVRFKNDKSRSKSVYEGLNPLIGDDIAKVISFIVNCPDNVNISDLTVLAKSQASSTVLNRK